MDHDHHTFNYSDYYDIADHDSSGFEDVNTRTTGPIRLVIFLICAGCAGWAALVWALVLLRRHRKHGGRIPAFVIIVLLNTMLELLLNPYVITKLIQDDHCSWGTDTTCRTLFSIWVASVMSGVHLQQMMVLESVLALRYPSCSDRVFFTPCSIILYTIAFASFFLCEFFDVHRFLLLSVIPLICVNVISWIVICRTSPNEHSSNRTKNPDYTVTLLAFTTTTLIIYFISLTLHIFIFSGYIFLALLMMSLCLLILRVMVDPLLCVLVCKQRNTQSAAVEEAEQSVEDRCNETVLHISVSVSG